MAIQIPFIVGFLFLNLFTQIALYPQYIKQKDDELVVLDGSDKLAVMTKNSDELNYGGRTNEIESNKITMGLLYRQKTPVCQVAIIELNAALVPASCLQRPYFYHIALQYSNKSASDFLSISDQFAVIVHAIHPNFDGEFSQFNLAIVMFEIPKKKLNVRLMQVRYVKPIENQLRFRIGGYDLKRWSPISGISSKYYPGTCFAKKNKHLEICTSEHNKSFLKQYTYGFIDILFDQNQRWLLTGISPPALLLSEVPFSIRISINPSRKWIKSTLRHFKILSSFNYRWCINSPCESHHLGNKS